MGPAAEEGGSVVVAVVGAAVGAVVGVAVVTFCSLVVWF